MSKINLSIVIPAYNEALRIEATLQAISKYLENQKYSYEIIVVDDGSTDNTIEVVGKYGVKIFKNERNMGKGYSVKRGMLSAEGEYRLFMDADHSVKIDNLERFMKCIEEGADVVIASIEVPGATIQDDNYGYRRIFGRLSKFLIRHIATSGIYDTQRGFKLFTESAANTIFPVQRINRWGFDIEILTIAQKKGMKIKELAVEWVNSKASSVTLSSYFYTLYELVKIKMIKSSE
jgi:dolichyl-phosphate beta-glucosyltransferase